MNRILLKSKIHGAIVTESNLDYEGSISIPVQFLEMANIIPGEQVHVWNVTNGNRIQTYAIENENPAFFSVNGAGAHLFSPGDKIIIATFGHYNEEECTKHSPKIIIMNGK